MRGGCRGGVGLVFVGTEGGVDGVAVLFDCDGVLVDSAASIRRSWQRWCDIHEIDATSVVAVAHGRRSIDTIRRAPHLDVIAETTRFEQIEVANASSTQAVRGALELVRSLRCRWAVVTSASRRLAVARLESAGFELPAVLVTADDVERGKPDPDGYRAAANALGVPASQCVVIEDADSGVRAGLAAGCVVIGVGSAVTVDGARRVRALNVLRVSSRGDRVTFSW
jgi:mannitol-1-/sugar-/sorbitol-6-phosphatase